VVEVSFHDTARARRRVPLLNDFFGFSVGALGERGAVYASRAAPDAPSTLVYRPFDAWADNTDWAAGLPAGEEAECVAAGATFCAAATSARLLRLFSQAGLQTAVLTLGGAPVALAARGHCLAAAWHAAAPTPGGDQCLSYAVHDVTEQRLLHSGALPLSAGASLAWLGFSAEGQLTSVDSLGVLRLRTPEFGGAWVPAFSAAAERKGAENFWVFAVGGGEAQCIVCANASEPAVPSGAARPVVSAVALRVPVLRHDDALAPLESELLRAGLVLSHAASAAAGDAPGEGDDPAALEAAVRASQVAADRAAVRLFTKLVQSDRQARALEVAAALHTPAALAGAMKIANHQRAGALADHIAAMIERRMEADAAAEAAATLAPPPAYASAAAAAPAPAFGGGDARQEASPLPAAGHAPAANPFARKDAAGGGGPAAAAREENGSPGGGGQKQAAAAPAVAKRKAPVGNPFARKKQAS
jgi:chromosome transmission fidelity protein 4